jgi:hypothetical protein
MKNSRRRILSIHFLYKSALVLSVIVLGIAISPILKAQPVRGNLQTQQVLPGLFTPTNSQRFFEAGRNQFEREIQNLRERDNYAPEDLLQINPEVLGSEALESLENPQLVLDATNQLEE